jgi:Zn-dependent metalloprotease
MPLCFRRVGLLPGLVLASLAAAGERPDPRVLGQKIDALAAQGALRLMRTQPDGDFPDRQHLRYDQMLGGVRVIGAQLVRQIDAGGETLSVHGAIHEGLRAETKPSLTAEQAARAAERASLRGAWAVGDPELVLLPRAGGASLTWMVWIRFDHWLERVFVDARTGEIVWRYGDLRTGAAVGIGTGVWGDRKKVSVDFALDGYRAEDRLRPPALTTYDYGHDLSAANVAFTGGILDPGRVARSADNTWTDGAVVDAHVYAGLTYDYYFRRLNRRGIDGRDLPVRSVTHFLPRIVDFANAFWDPFQNAVYYGDGDPTYAAFSGAIDVVAHELTHGVTQYTWDGIYAGESGALNEAFSDIMGTAVEFFHEAAGSGRQRADYYLGEDLARAFDPARYAVRSMAEPWRHCSESLGICDPDHYSALYRGPLDGGGVHHNNAVANHAFYLLVEGGVNRTSGRRVAGLGPASREKAERIFYRGFTAYLTPSASFADARGATIRAARDLYGEAEAAEVASAWAAVGVE